MTIGSPFFVKCLVGVFVLGVHPPWQDFFFFFFNFFSVYGKLLERFDHAFGSPRVCTPTMARTPMHDHGFTLVRIPECVLGAPRVHPQCCPDALELAVSVHLGVHTAP